MEPETEAVSGGGRVNGFSCPAQIAERLKQFSRVPWIERETAHRVLDCLAFGRLDILAENGEHRDWNDG
jgi:hypothetical protein